MKCLTVALLISSVLAPTAVAQDQSWQLFPHWFEMVKRAERAYKKKKGRYGDLAALRKAHLLPTSEKAPPKGMVFEVTTSEAGRHFLASITDMSLTLIAGDQGGERSSPVHRDFEDNPEGPIISVAR